MAPEYDEETGTYTDEYGTRYKLDHRGNRVPPDQAEKLPDGSYDSTHHCGLCGSLYCRGGCFK